MKKMLITGGSQGIGLELAKAFAKDGNALFLVAKEDGLLPLAIENLKKDYFQFDCQIKNKLKTRLNISRKHPLLV